MKTHDCSALFNLRSCNDEIKPWLEESACDDFLDKDFVSSYSDWGREQEENMQTLGDDFTTKWQELSRIEVLEAEICLLKERCNIIEQASPLLVPIESLSPEPYKVIKPFNVIVRFQDDQYISSFFDANISTSGDTQEEAVLNLKDLIVTMYDMLNDMDDGQLGIEPMRQKILLNEYICPKE